MQKPNNNSFIDEITAKLTPIGIDPAAVELISTVNSLGTGSETPVVSIKINHPEIAENPLLTAAIVKAVQDCAMPGAKVEIFANDFKAEQDALLLARPAFRMSLIPAVRSAAICTTKDALLNPQGTSASCASRVFKSDQRPRIPFHVVKSIDMNGDILTSATTNKTQYERIVTGVVLEPEVVDGSKTIDNEGNLESEGDIYSIEEICKAMYWWMENSRNSFTYHHVELGGKPLKPEDVVILECWQTRVDQTIGNQDIPAGTWMLTVRVNSDTLWRAILAGEINSWSIGVEGLGSVGEVVAPPA